MTRTILPILVAAAVFANASAAAAAARTEVRPTSTLAVDAPAQLVVIVDGPAARPPAVRIPDADVRYLGEMASTSILNGRRTVETSFVYQLVPRVPGELAIPAIDVGADRTAPLRVTVAASARSARAAGATGATRAAPSADAPGREPAPRQAFVRLEVPTRTLYVGEAVPVKIRAYFREGTAATLQGPPRINSAAFTLSALSDEPAQAQVEIDGVPHLRATWDAVLSPAKPTTDEVAIEIPVEIAYRERRAVARPSIRDLLAQDPFASDLDALFDDPFFAGDPLADLDAMFDVGPLRRRQLTLRHDIGRVRIADVPAAGKPAGFGGAVGTFALALEAPAAPLRVGEPATLTFRVSGTGNFDRVALAGIEASDDWKVYPGKATLEPGTGTRATKTFTQTIVPARAGTLAIPAVALAYFDPEARAYRTATTAPLEVEVAPAPDGGAADPGLATVSARDGGGTPNRVARGATHATLVPLIRQGSFWRLPIALAVLAAVLVAAAWRRRSPWMHAVRGARDTRRAVARERAKLDAAARAADPAAFFAAARTALQVRLAAAWGVAPETITGADVADRLGDRGDAIREVLDHADRITYAPGTASPGALDHWRTIVHQQLANLEARR